MSAGIADELLRIVIARHGDDWTIIGLELSDRGRAFAGLEFAPRTGPDSSPGALLEAIGQTLDGREAERLDRRVGVDRPAPFEPPADAVVELAGSRPVDDEDVARILEVLEDLGGRSATTSTLAILAGFDTLRGSVRTSDGRRRALACLRELERRQAVIGTQHPNRAGDYLWSFREAAEAIRHAAGDDPRGEADR